ncbi:ribosomal-protein-alanine acetyltransferase [Winogradskyella epiphytica]|uniref:Ribosomal-protein-alanine acetyltransferase n=1 Tax=Winogradskyella epiphytica TaxID=262005 RepID=A0A2V4XGW5_9FLAO|nr:GNAT family N-acetyltransferase [Winogradskyella epiphytica]PYE82741.1 ribosomal-protein-alanine acetyltransferase [Winogradskyella epiphytica]GGW53297.1 N-acetyltransferase [Winogradskyella epiphytica]
MLKFRQAELNDLESIIAIEQQIFSTDSYPAFVVRQLFDISGHNFVVAEEHNQILGYALGSVNSKRKQGWILSMGVDKVARGRGLGKQVTKHLMEVLKAEDVKEIALTVFPENATAIKIYKNLGFQKTQVLENYFLDNEERIVMTLRVNEDRK